jgi:Poly(3-hydroxybutyrate) depolymerase
MNEQTIKKKRNLVLLFALIFISSCGGGGGSVATPDEPDPIPSPNSSVPSCSNYSSIENTQYCSFTKDGLTREFYIYVPSSYSEYISPVSVLFSLHGGGDYAETNMQYSGFKEHADTDTFILIYPQGSYYEDKGTTGWNTEEDGVNDVAFIESIIDWTGNNYNVQLNEVYAAGFSNGGFMAYHLACNLSAKNAAIAPVAGFMGNITIIHVAHFTPLH